MVFRNYFRLKLAFSVSWNIKRDVTKLTLYSLRRVSISCIISHLSCLIILRIAKSYLKLRFKHLLEEQVISLYARGMSTRDSHDQIKDIYGIEVSAEMVSKITERIVPEIKEWQNRSLDP